MTTEGSAFDSRRGGMTSRGPETVLVGAIRTAIKKTWPNAWIVKTTGGPYQSSGLPDLLVIVDGRVAGLEVKAQRPRETPEHARERATPGQRAVLDAIRRAGGVGGVVLTVPEALELVAHAASKDPGTG